MKTLAALVALLLVCVGCSDGGGASTAPSSSPIASASASAAAAGGVTVVDCDPATDDACQVAGLRVTQPVPVGEQVRLSVRIRNDSEETAGPITITVRDSLGEANLGDLLPIAGCSKPCEPEVVDDGLELRAEWQAPIEPGKAITLTLVLTAKEAADHQLDVAVFASPMADVPVPAADDPTRLSEWLGVVATVEPEE